jgi:flagellar assembly protein FliH
LSAAPEASAWGELGDLAAPDGARPDFEPLHLEAALGLPAEARRVVVLPNADGSTRKAHTEADAERVRLQQAAQNQAAEIEQAARAQAAEIERLARAQAAEFEALANEKAEQVVQTAKEQAAEVTRLARREGYEAAEADAGQLLLAAQGVLDEVRVWRTSMFTQSEQAILNLVAHIAKVLFGEGVTLPREALEAAFGRALTEARPLGNLRVRMHPSDAAILSPAWAQQAVPAGQRLELVPDESVRRGGCLVEGDHGMVDARLDTQLQLALNALMPDVHPPQEENAGDSPS